MISLFQNLIDNAQKYSPDGSEINIYSESNPNKTIICVSDQGVGIAENEKLKIFDRFYRIEDEEEAFDMGIEEYFDSDAWCFVEWPEKVENVLPLDSVVINLSINQDNTRTIEIN